MNQMVVFDPKLSCKFSDVKTAIVEEKSEPARRNPTKARTGIRIKRRAASIAKCTQLSRSHATKRLPAAA